MSAANVSSSRDTATFKVVVWPRDRAFYFARFRGPLLIAAVLLLVLLGSWWGVRRRDRAAEQEAEAEHLLAPPLGHAVLEPALLDCREPLGRHGGKQLDYRQRRRAV